MAEPKIADLQKSIASLESRLKSAEGKNQPLLKSRVKETEGLRRAYQNARWACDGCLEQY